MRVLLIAMETEEAGRLQGQFEGVVTQRLELELCSDLDEARQKLQDNSFELVLFDMHGGESDVPPLAAFLNRNVGAHVIVLVQGKDEETGKRALKLGVDQYCIKEQLLSDLVLCICQYADRRGHLRGGAVEAQGVREQVFGKNASLPYSSQLPGDTQSGERLSVLYEESFQQLVRRFGDLLELALERLMYKVDVNLSSTLQNLAAELGRMRATPRDLVEIYTTCLESRRQKGNDQRYKAYADEGRLLLLETMGYLTHFYRSSMLQCDEQSRSRKGESPPHEN